MEGSRLARALVLGCLLAALLFAVVSWRQDDMVAASAPTRKTPADQQALATLPSPGARPSQKLTGDSEQAQPRRLLSPLVTEELRWQRYQLKAKDAMDLMSFCRREISAPELQHCLYEASSPCDSFGRSGAEEIALLELRLTNGASHAQAQLNYCRSYWAATESPTQARDDLQLQLVNAGHPRAIFGLAQGYPRSNLSLDARRELVRQAWLSKDPVIVGTVEDRSVAYVSAPEVSGSETSNGSKQYESAVAVLLTCALSDCGAETIAMLSSFCNQQLPRGLCPVDMAPLSIARMMTSPDQYRQAEAYVADLLSHLDRGDTDWPALQRFLDTLPREIAPRQ